MKKLIRLTEQDLHRIVKESVGMILKEAGYDIDDDRYYGGGLPTKYFQDDDFPYEENDFELADGTKVTDLQHGDMLKHIKTNDYAFVERVFDDCINVVGGVIPKDWVGNWCFVKHNAL